MSYEKMTCAECKLPMVGNDNILPEHKMPGSKVRCEGSGEPSVEAEAKAEAEAEATTAAAHAPFKIEKGIELLKKSNGKANRFAEAFRQMEIGDSFLCPNAGKHSHNTARTQAKKVGIEIAVRRISDDSIRIWRTK